MAKKKAAKKAVGGVNKSAEIRAYKEANPDAKPKAIVEALLAKGVEVSPAQVSTTLSNQKKNTGAAPGKRGRRPGLANAQIVGGKGFAAQLNAAGALIDAAGSIESAIDILKAVGRLKSSVPF